MIVYYLLFLFCLLVGLYAKTQQGMTITIGGTETINRKKYSTALFLAVIAISIVVGFRRFDVGIDTQQTMNNYLSSSRENFELEIEIIRPAIALVCRALRMDLQFYMFIIAMMTMGLFARYIYKTSDDLLLSLIVYLGLFFPQSLNLTGQWLSLAFGVNALVEFRENRKRAAFVFLLLAVLTHVSAMVLVSFFLYSLIKDKKKALPFFAVGAIVIFAVQDLIISVILRLIPRYSSYVTGSRFGGGGVSNIKIFIYVAILAAMLYLIYMKSDRLTEEERDSLCECASFLFIAVALSIAGSDLRYMNRVAYYFSITLICGIPLVLKKLHFSGTLKILACAAMFYMLYRNSINDSSGIYPYHWFWQ